MFVILTEVTCPSPSQPLNTLFTKEAHCVDGFKYTSVCRFPCKEGFHRDNGIQSITCQENGIWYPPMAANCTGGFFYFSTCTSTIFHHVNALGAMYF